MGPRRHFIRATDSGQKDSLVATLGRVCWSTLVGDARLFNLKVVFETRSAFQLVLILRVVHRAAATSGTNVKEMSLRPFKAGQQF